MKNLNQFCLLVFSLTVIGCAHNPSSTNESEAPSTTRAPAEASVDHNQNVVEELKSGNYRFRTNQRIHPRQNDARLEEMSAGQKPGAVVVSCSDSRVPPEIIFDQGLGDLFSVRTAGQALDPLSVASIEYAVETLGAKVIVMMGHTSCGAIKTAAATPENKSTGSENLDQLIHKIRVGLKKFDSNDRQLIEAAKHNVEATVEYLKQTSPLLRKELEEQKIHIVTAIYHLPTGEVEFW